MEVHPRGVGVYIFEVTARKPFSKGKTNSYLNVGRLLE